MSTAPEPISGTIMPSIKRVWEQDRSNVGRKPGKPNTLKKEIALIARRHGDAAVSTLAKIMHGLPEEVGTLTRLREVILRTVDKPLDADTAKLMFFWIDELAGVEVSAQTRAWCADKILDRGYGKPTEHINLESERVPNLAINFVNARKPVVGTGGEGAGADTPVSGDGGTSTGTE